MSSNEDRAVRLAGIKHRVENGAGGFVVDVDRRTGVGALLLNARGDLAWLLSELEAAQARLDRARRADIQLAIHRAVCEDALAHCVENRGRCVRSAEAASWALGLGEEGTDGR